MSESKKEQMLEWVKMAGHERGRYSRLDSSEMRDSIYRIISGEKPTVTQDKLLEWAFKHATESNVAIIHSDLVALLAELGIEVKP